MEIKDQVASLESSKRLKELGVKQESLFWWTQDKTPRNPNIHEYGIPQKDMDWRLMFGKQSRISTNSVYEEFSAFTVAELGDLLPSHVQGNKLRQFKLFGDRCEIVYGVEPVFIENTEAEARSKMLIYLLENKLI